MEALAGVSGHGTCKLPPRVTRIIYQTILIVAYSHPVALFLLSACARSKTETITEEEHPKRQFV